ncbi:penicillin-binding transpeptidase domain-containing protein [Pseudoduganella buxea]|uniref:Penicillin-binding protein transpeptidase domain-containing protein n=2 Tax=Pseudoduganella buxea TaxID=1949069 RepID=A0ABQ1LGP5_9BURK|nr:penicillin-binding transpeptidase domain-containing protein [Pseudoduganella buxea]GGC23120.1 hypothetical protein GCM10011572_50790 [Pseudoduganella buxea]
MSHFFLTQLRDWRRARNLGRARRPRARPWTALGLALLALAGAWLIASHARRLGEAAPLQGADAQRAANVLQAVLPGAAFTVPDAAGVTMLQQPGGAVAIVAGMRPEPPVTVDLCRQMRDGAGGRLVPLRLGVPLGEVRRAAPGSLRQVVLAGGARHDATTRMPRVTIGGGASADVDGTPLRLDWHGPGVARWLGGGTIVTGTRAETVLARQGWLAWPGGALHVERRAASACAAGELVLRLYAPGEGAGRALVTAFGAGRAATLRLAPGSYAIPAAPAPELEDAALFAALRQAGLLRLSRHGAIALAPADLPAWADAAGTVRATALPEWADVRVDDAARKLLRRLYRQADGTYLRRQVELYNSERSLLAWRQPDGDMARWQVGGAAGPLAATQAMPPAAARLFDELPQGWQPWSRVARWPAGGQAVQLTLPLRPGSSRPLHLLVAGSVQAVRGATVRATPACTGKACTAPGDVTRLVLQPAADARAVVLTIAPLPAASMTPPGNDAYRHLRVVAGRIAWQPLAPTAQAVVPRATGTVTLTDRHGAPLWADGAPTAAATRAGLATLVGLGPEQQGGIAAMLMRAGGNAGRLTLELPVQALAHDILACVGMRRGAWDGRRCQGGTAPPPGREAGLVVLDSENGDILAAAGAGTGRADRANWAEVRDFDRMNPARGPLRLPALQHDGGARRSPGSTFKIVSALGLELAARNDARLDALLGGVPLDQLNATARARGFDFATTAATYPATAHGARITNYREQGVEGRAQAGRLGLAQALTYSLNTWFAWAGELSDATLFGRGDGGVPDAQALDAGALDESRPILAAARRLGFEQPVQLDGGLLPPGFAWRQYDALQATPSHVDPIRSRHELRQMSIGLRMQTTPLQMAMAAGAIGQGATVTPRLLVALDGLEAAPPAPRGLAVRLDRVRAGMKGVIDAGTAAGAFRCAGCAPLRAGLFGKTGTAPVTDNEATVWFTGWLEPGTLPGQARRLAFAVFVSRSEGTGGDHAAPVAAALLATLAGQRPERRTEGKTAMLIGQ